MKIVGLVGPKRSGKDTAASALVEQRGYVRVGFADAVKDLALRANPLVGGPYRLASLVEDFGWERAKERDEVRRLLQELGAGVRDIVGDESWIDAWRDRVYRLTEDGRHRVVVPDVRFYNEAEWMRPGLLIRITRPGLDLSDSQSSTKFEVAGARSLRSTIDTHVSETEQAGIQCDAEIVNDGTPEQLHAKVLAIVDGWA